MSSTRKTNRKLADYGLVLALICVALALLAAKYSRQQPSVAESSVENPDMRYVFKAAMPE